MKRKNKKEGSSIKEEPLVCIDLFAGAGGLSLAAMNVGLKVKVAVEKNPHACNTYRENLIKNRNLPVLYESDVLELSPLAIMKEHFCEPGRCDLLLGGPPCQGFSVHRIKNAGIGDPRNRLIIRYFEFVEALRPKAFLMENVPGILWPRHKKYLDEFYQKGAKAGYLLKKPVILDARDYGVPQRRKRVFILGIRKDFEFPVEWPPIKTHENPLYDFDGLKLKPWRRAEEVFKKAIPLEDENNVHMKHTPELIEVFRSTPLNGGSRASSKRVLPCHRNHNGHKDVYGRIDPFQPGPTMTTACINPSKGRFVHPTEHHGITVRHAARFQTFPDWFVFKGGLISAGEQIGNAVPIFLGESVIKAVKMGISEMKSKYTKGAIG